MIKLNVQLIPSTNPLISTIFGWLNFFMISISRFISRNKSSDGTAFKRLTATTSSFKPEQSVKVAFNTSP